MRAVVAQTLGPAENYRIVDLPVPSPGPGQVLIRVTVSGLGYVDGLVSRGL